MKKIKKRNESLFVGSGVQELYTQTALSKWPYEVLPASKTNQFFLGSLSDFLPSFIHFTQTDKWD